MRGSEDLAFIAHNAMRDEEVGQISNAIGDFMLARDDIQKKLSTVTNPDAYISTHQAALTAAKNDIVARFPTGGMRDKLTGELNIHLADTMQEVTRRAVVMQVDSAEASLKSALGKYATLAATASNPKDRDYAVGQGYGLINGYEYWTPGEKAAHQQEFSKNVDLMGLQHQIGTDPSTAMVALSAPDFDAKHPLIAPEEKMRLQSQADTALRFPLQQIEAQHAAASAQVLNKLLVNAHNGNLNPGDVQHAYDAGLISPAEFKWLLPGQKPIEPSDPGVLKNLKDAIDDNPMAMSRYDILVSPGVQPHDAAALTAYLAKSQDNARKTIGATALQLKHRLQNELLPSAMVVINPAARKAQIEQFNDDFKSIQESAKSVQDLYRGADELRKIYGRGAGMKKPPPPLPGESDAAYGARIRAAGGIF